MCIRDRNNTFEQFDQENVVGVNYQTIVSGLEESLKGKLFPLQRLVDNHESNNTVLEAYKMVEDFEVDYEKQVVSSSIVQDMFEKACRNTGTGKDGASMALLERELIHLFQCKDVEVKVLRLITAKMIDSLVNLKENFSRRVDKLFETVSNSLYMPLCEMIQIHKEFEQSGKGFDDSQKGLMSAVKFTGTFSKYSESMLTTVRALITFNKDCLLYTSPSPRDS
eukprot:TRINITY_DN4159_c0_g1_i1.p1 TRINITY_DN4159_c0_g1~~TRINITY_DN4159_c0_g1_i1.p1  ORF type:complete len:223 (-),score=29.37 TRINITY_DN4159_c0_g1_i1:41-709(-)